MRKWLWTIPPWTLTVVARWMMNLRFCWIKIHVYFWCREIELIQFSSVSQSCPTLCEPMDCSTPGLPVHHSNHLILCHPLLLLPSIFQSIRVFSNESALQQSWSFRVLEFQLQHQSFQWTPRTDLLYNGLVGSPCSPRDSQESSPTPQSKSINTSVLSFHYSQALTSIHDYWKNHSPD